MKTTAKKGERIPPATQSKSSTTHNESEYDGGSNLVQNAKTIHAPSKGNCDQGGSRGQRKQAQQVENAHQRRWTRAEVETLVQKRSEGLSFKAISTQYLQGKSKSACLGRYKRLKWDDEANPVLPSDVEPAGTVSSTLPDEEEKGRSMVPMPAGVVRFFGEIPEKVREASAPYFTMLQHADFSSYRQSLDDWRAGTAWRAENIAGFGSCPHPLPLSVVSVLSWNDHLSATRSAVGRFRTDWSEGSQTLIYLADRAWTEAEQRDYRKATPRQQLHWSGPYLHWHWQDPRTAVLPISVVAGAPDDEGNTIFHVKLPNVQRDQTDPAPLFMLVGADCIYLASVRDVHDHFLPIQHPHNGGHVQAECRIPSSYHAVWSEQKRRISLKGDRLEGRVIDRLLALHRRLRDRGCMEGTGLQQWGDVFEDIMPGK